MGISAAVTSAAGKTFNLWAERYTFQLRVDAINALNHANFGNPSSLDVEGNPSAFGKIVSTVGTPRLIQFSLRWAF